MSLSFLFRKLVNFHPSFDESDFDDKPDPDKCRKNKDGTVSKDYTDEAQAIQVDSLPAYLHPPNGDG